MRGLLNELHVRAAEINDFWLEKCTQNDES